MRLHPVPNVRRPPPPPSPPGLQVIELQAGVDSRAAWHEAQVLQRCAHARIVPLFGVAIKVGGRGGGATAGGRTGSV